MSYKISKNLEELLHSLIEDQINDKSIEILKEIINIQNKREIINKEILIKNLSMSNNNEINIQYINIIDRLINLNFIEINNINNNIILKINNILNILLYPRYCYYVNVIYGPKCLQIIEYLLEFGFYSLDNNNNSQIININFTRDDFSPLVVDGIIIKINMEKTSMQKDMHINEENNKIFNTNIQEIYKINYNLLNWIIFREYTINFYKQYISMNFNFYEIFKKVVKSDNFSYELKNYEKSLLDQITKDNYDYDKLLLKENNTITLNKDIIKYDLFYNSIEKIIKLLYSTKHIRILKVIQRNENLNIFQISQKVCLKHIEVEEIIEDLLNKIKIIKIIKNNENNNNIIDDNNNVYCLKEINEMDIKNIKDNIYGIIKNIKFELKDKLKELQGRINKETEIQYINKYYSLINDFSEILNLYNCLFNN